MNEELIKTALPDKLSELIRVAQADLRACEKDPLYRINMHSWHKNNGAACAVCLAGSVMAGTLGVPDYVTVDPDSFTDGIRRKLESLDDVRRGHITTALEHFGGGEWPDPEASIYTGNGEEFHAYLTRIADELEAAGL